MYFQRILYLIYLTVKKTRKIQRWIYIAQSPFSYIPERKIKCPWDGTHNISFLSHCRKPALLFQPCNFSMIATGDIAQQHLEKIGFRELVISFKVVFDAMKIDRM